MTVQECYALIEGDYNNVLQRLGKVDLVERFLLKFPDDKSFEELKEAMAKEDVDGAFRASHTMKGLCANLGIARLGKSSSDICEALRAKDFETAKSMLDGVVEDYRITIEGIDKYKAEK